MLLLGARLQPHDASLSLYDGKCIRFIKTERIKQQKHHGYDWLAEWRDDIKKEWGIDYRDIDEMALSMHYGLVEHHSMSTVLKDCLFKQFDLFPAPISVWNIDHHYAHALSHIGLVDPDVSIVIDEMGEDDSTWTVFKDDLIVDRGYVSLHGSIGNLMGNIGANVGVSSPHVLDLAGKTMGLQSYGKFDIGFYQTIKHLSIHNINSLSEVGRWIAYHGDRTLANIRLIDWIHTVHVRIGETILELFKKHCKPDDVIYYSGGVAQNVIWNSLLKRHFKNLVILPHVGDDGTSLGAVEFLRRKNNLPQVPLTDFPFCVHDQSPTSKPSVDTIHKTAQYLSEGKIVAWYQGHGEMGFRALGNRSILMDPRIPHGKDVINSVKMREKYRPFGASILEEHTDSYFDMPFSNDYMLYIGESKTSDFPAINHVDSTCRIQTVKSGSGFFRDLLEQFYHVTSCPVLLNTSLNLAGKPIAGTIAEAEELFATSPIDVLVIGDSIKTKL